MNDITIRDTVFECLDEYDEQMTPIAIRSFGSHMMNCDSPNSDYDVMCLFSQPCASYAKVNGYRDTVSRKLDDDIELQAWNIKKFAKLLDESNPTTMEFINSPARYYTKHGCKEPLNELQEMANESFKPIACYHHYRSMAESNYHKYITNTLYDDDGNTRRVVLDGEDRWLVESPDGDGKEVIPKDSDFEKAEIDRTAKRYLYILRAVLYAKYIRKTGEFPTMDFPQFVDECNLVTQSPVSKTIESLIETKTNPEKDSLKEVGNPAEQFIESEFDYDFEEPRFDREMDTEQINEFVERVTT